MTAPLPTPSLGPAARTAALERLAGTDLDVLVVGGGVVGAGAALDAATRGLSVGLVEARDWASGTSSRSSKLVHGGLRYLEMLDFRLVAEALRERSLLLNRLAPHLVRPVAFLYPLTGRGWERPYVGAGIALYDGIAAALGRGERLPRHRHLSRRGARTLAPALSKSALVGAVQYWDAQVDDARHTMSHRAHRGLLRRRLRQPGPRHGAAARGRAGHRRAGARPRVGARARRARQAGRQRHRRLDRRHAGAGRTRAASSTYARARACTCSCRATGSPRRTGLILRTATSVLFVIPWGRHWIIGTTDTDWSLDKSHPAVSARDVEYLLTELNKVLASPLVPEDVVGVYAGLRPLLAGESDQTSKLSREHLVGHPVPGLVVVAGGKYTTYRVMAKDAVDEAVRAMDGVQAECVTEDVPLVGADGWPALWNRRHAIAEESGLHVARIEHLLHRYGSLTHDVLALIAADPSLAQPLPSSDDYLRAEVVYAAAHEGALHLDDVLARRTRISIESWDRGVDAAPVVADLMGDVLGWSPEQRQREIEHYLARVSAERDAQAQPNDLTADAARLGAPDIVPVA